MSPGDAAPVVAWHCPLCGVSGLSFDSDINAAVDAFEDHLNDAHNEQPKRTDQ